ncbi:MAG: (d)CMP kinase [Pseudomonadales bacterium]|nr:(d)CMP kinase [Pseudomonadales bacterium]MDP6472058.1 (d)CMP kinase [Pseudomonadales bacterium]MDP6826669.1 (d)CMP kinase [Pseudomonadales bacterium]MDP6969970.1 (d)CMP kinase [Pseudomonadales bacterium]
MRSEIPVVAIDGPSGSGKGTLAAMLAERLGWHYLDSGALYRVVAAAALARSVALDDETALARLVGMLEIEFRGQEVVVDGEDLGGRIRHDEVSITASRVAALPAVRAAILDIQHSMRRPPGLVADGRDMGTEVFPDALLKIFLDASAQVRAERRYKQLKNKGLDVSVRALLANIQERDERDRGRAASPLVPAEDAEILNSTTLTIDEVLNRVHALVCERIEPSN